MALLKQVVVVVVEHASAEQVKLREEGERPPPPHVFQLARRQRRTIVAEAFAGMPGNMAHAIVPWMLPRPRWNTAAAHLFGGGGVGCSSGTKRGNIVPPPVAPVPLVMPLVTISALFFYSSRLPGFTVASRTLFVCACIAHRSVTRLPRAVVGDGPIDSLISYLSLARFHTRYCPLHNVSPHVSSHVPGHILHLHRCMTVVPRWFVQWATSGAVFVCHLASLNSWTLPQNPLSPAPFFFFSFHTSRTPPNFFQLPSTPSHSPPLSPLSPLSYRLATNPARASFSTNRTRLRNCIP